MDFKMNQAKEEQEKRQQFCELHILRSVLIEWALQWSAEGHISEEHVDPSKDIPSRHPNQIGAYSLRSVIMTIETAHVLKN